LAFAAVAAGTALRPMSTKIDEYVLDLMEGDGEMEYALDPEDGNVEVSPQFIISWQVRRFIRKLQKQMPCGWEQYGIPPLAPLKVTEATFDLEKSIVHTINEVFRFRIDGLDAFKIKKLNINLIFNRIKFDFLFSNIRASAQKYDTDTMIDLLRQLGLSVEYEGDGSLDFGLVNLRLAGTLKYKIPILWGSVKITSLKTKVTLEKCNSDISGFMGDGKLNRMVNDQVEGLIESSVNDNEEAVSNLIEDNLVPRVNKLLKGNNFWTILAYILSSSDGENEDDPIVTNCVAPADPWA